MWLWVHSHLNRWCTGRFVWGYVLIQTPVHTRQKPMIQSCSTSKWTLVRVALGVKVILPNYVEANHKNNASYWNYKKHYIVIRCSAIRRITDQNMVGRLYKDNSKWLLAVTPKNVFNYSVNTEKFNFDCPQQANNVWFSYQSPVWTLTEPNENAASINITSEMYEPNWLSN